MFTNFQPYREEPWRSNALPADGNLSKRGHMILHQEMKINNLSLQKVGENIRKQSKTQHDWSSLDGDSWEVDLFYPPLSYPVSGFSGTDGNSIEGVYGEIPSSPNNARLWLFKGTRSQQDHYDLEGGAHYNYPVDVIYSHQLFDDLLFGEHLDFMHGALI